MDSRGNLNSESKKRAAKAFEIFKKNQAARIITCGWAYRNDCEITIAEAMKRYLISSYSIRENLIIKQTNSRDTVGDAIFSRLKILTNDNFRKIALITSSYHLRRTKEIFNFVFGQEYNFYFYTCPIKVNKKLLDLENESFCKFKETFNGIDTGNINKIYSRLIVRHPYYNGEIYEKENDLL